jgi:hypothetical protein
MVSLGFANLPSVHGVGEVYTLSLSSSRVQEYNTPGVTLFLNVTKATIGVSYQFTFTVNDPTGAGKNAANSTTAVSASFVLSVVYPRDFGTSLNYVGNYTINVLQNKPSNIPSVATGRFQVGLTDSINYQRTSSISIEATGYAANANITTSLSQGGSPAPGFPRWVLADGLGNLKFSWHISPTLSLGSYTLALAGSTVKDPPDTQTLSVSTTSVNIPGLTVQVPNIQRSLIQQLIFVPQYPDGGRVQTGKTTIRIAEPDGVTFVSTTATFDVLSGTFRATYTVLRNATAGIWIATVNSNYFDDGYGNLGPPLAVSAGFNVQPANLNVTLAPAGTKAYSPGDLIPIYASISFPDGSTFRSGTVVAKFTHNGSPAGTPVTLAYVSGQQSWAGTYQVTSSDPSGVWLITVDASDVLVDSGEGTHSAVVSVPPAPPQSTGLSTYSFIFLITAIIAAVILGFLFWALILARKKARRGEVKLDLKIVDKEVDRISGGEFFQNVKKQVEDRKIADEGSHQKEEGKGSKSS